MRQILAIVLAFASLLSNVEAWSGEACSGQVFMLAAAAPCGCCAQQTECGCTAESKSAPVQVPVPVSVRHEVPAFAGVLLPMIAAPAPALMSASPAWIKAEQGMAPATRHIPVFILHCVALC